MSIKKLKNWLQDITYQRRFYPYLAAILTGIIVLGAAVFLFLNLVRGLNETLNEPVTQLPPPQKGIDFEAIDKIALKMGIEIPARGIPSQKELARNNPPQIFRFTSIRSQVLTGEQITIFLNAADPEGDEMKVNWSSTAGKLSLLSPYGPARWTAPDKTGSYSIRVAVNDEKPGHRDVEASLPIEVIPRPAGEIPPQEIPEFATRLVGLVKEEGGDNIYLVKTEQEKFYKRLVVDPKIIDFYDDLTLSDVEIVSQGALDGYELINWIRGKERYKVYQINEDATKQWLNMSWETFLAGGGSHEKIFTVKDEEIEFYSSGPDMQP